MKMMFEVEDLLEASPATVSRCGMVYVSPEKIGWQVLTTKWIANLPDVLKEHGIDAMYIEMIDGIIPSVMDFLFGKNQSSEEDLRLQSLKPIVPTSKVWQFKSFLNLFEALLLNCETRETLIEK
jgi:dynein heavy chain